MGKPRIREQSPGNPGTKGWGSDVGDKDTIAHMHANCPQLDQTTKDKHSDPYVSLDTETNRALSLFTCFSLTPLWTLIGLWG